MPGRKLRAALRGQTLTHPASGLESR